MFAEDLNSYRNRKERKERFIGCGVIGFVCLMLFILVWSAAAAIMMDVYAIKACREHCAPFIVSQCLIKEYNFLRPSKTEKLVVCTEIKQTTIKN